MTMNSLMNWNRKMAWWYAVIIPSPFYSGFAHDFERSHVSVVAAPLPAETNFELTVAALDAALVTARRTGQRVRAVLLCSPDNPTGNVLALTVPRAVVDWTRTHALHLIADEMYRGCVHQGSTFASALSQALPTDTHVHTVYGLAKDFGLCGFKVAALHSRNTSLLAAMQSLCLFSPVSTYTQHAVTQLLCDRLWVRQFRAENKRRLTQAFAVLRTYLTNAGFARRLLPAWAGFFCMDQLG